MNKYLDETKTKLIKESLENGWKTKKMSKELLNNKDFKEIQRWMVSKQLETEEKYLLGYKWGFADLEKLIFDRKDRIKLKNLEKDMENAIKQRKALYDEAVQYANWDFWEPDKKLGNYLGMNEAVQMVKDILKGENNDR